MKILMEKKQPKKADIYLYDIIGDSWDGTTAKQFAADLKALGDDIDTLNIFMNSPGGVVFDGVAIYNTLVRHRAKKYMNVDGLAGSIASVILMAGDEISIAKNGIVMIHNPTASAFMANAEQMRETANKLDLIRGTILVSYADRVGEKSTEKQISDWMDAETWMTASEAVARGFADTISEKEVEIAALVKHDLTQFRNKPSTFSDKSPEVAGSAAKPHPAIAQAALRLAKRINTK